jgi:hypothetical protein
MSRLKKKDKSPKLIQVEISYSITFVRAKIRRFRSPGASLAISELLQPPYEQVM